MRSNLSGLQFLANKLRGHCNGLPQRELPRIPFAKDFKVFSFAGRELADLHLNYETAVPYPLVVKGDEGNLGRVEK